MFTYETIIILYDTYISEKGIRIRKNRGGENASLTRISKAVQKPQVYTWNSISRGSGSYWFINYSNTISPIVITAPQIKLYHQIC